MVRRRRRHFHEHVEQDLEILPLMNLFVVLIPMLLISAVFLEMAVIRMNLPDGAAADERKRERLGLTIAIADASWTVDGRGLGSRTIERGTEGAEESLRAVLADVKRGWPAERDVVILSEPRTRYDDIVTVMDVSRETGLDNVSLARAGGEGSR